jgi:hypothetical protein
LVRGLHQAVHYDAALLKRVRDRLEDLFITEIRQGLRQDENPTSVPVRYGQA